MKKYLILFILLIPISVWPQGHVIGNGGDGYRLRNQQKIYLRDLIEAGVADSPWLGSEPDDDEILRTVSTANLSGPIKDPALRVLLIRKLTDLQIAAPPLGSLILEAIRKYHWELVDQTFSFIDDGHFIELPNTDRVQLAVRIYRTIHINKTDWALMLDAHRVALIFHEMTYSLLKPHCSRVKATQSKVCSQSPSLARQIVGHMFSDNSDGKISAVLRRDMEELAIPKNLPTELGKFGWMLDEYGFKGGSNQHFSPLIFTSLKTLDLSLSSECALATAAYRENPNKSVRILSKVQIPSYTLEFAPFPVKDKDFQYGLRISDLDSPSNEELTIKGSLNPEDCIRDLRTHAALALRYAY